MMKDNNKITKYRILSLKAEDIFAKGEGKGKSKGECVYSICKENGGIDLDQFQSFIYNSLETQKMQEVYIKEKKNRNAEGKFEIGGYNFGSDTGATLSVINVTFNNKTHRKFLYERGFSIKTDKAVNKYVRYKRSAGSSRQGNCLFIYEPLKKAMMKWTCCGLDESKVTDKVSWESYISLTLSNMRKEIKIPKESILVIPDATSIFEKEVIAVTKNERGGLDANRQVSTVENKIWDGQGLLDESVFEENGLGANSMMLLRNRFFKTCAFNTGLSRFFADRGITEVSQLNKSCFTLAKKISDIKLVITDSSLKYIKLHGGKRIDAISKWLNNVDDVFGLVKTEKKTKHLDGKMVQTSYQLINTLPLSMTEMEDFLKPSLDYLWAIQSDPAFMRHYLKMQLQEDTLEDYDEELDEEESEESEDIEDDDDEEIESGDDSNDNGRLRKNVMLKLLSLNDQIAESEVYSEFRQQIKRVFVSNLRRGHVLVDGTNATLFGNGYEMLCAVCDPEFDFDNPRELYLVGNEIRIGRFGEGQELLCARSPHITMGNLFLAKNRRSDSDPFAKYFNLTNEIVCVNSIGQELMDRLNGCDFDSDMMLVTDNKIMLNSAKKYYSEFLVPVCKAEHEAKDTSDIWKIDHDISNNEIGRIVNLSQRLNSQFWDKLSHGEWDENLYLEICKLSVLSGMEIDKAKRDYGINASKELDAVKDANITDDRRPSFMKYVKKKESKGDKHIEYRDDINTSMEYLNRVVVAGRKRSPKVEKLPLFPLLYPRELDVKDNDYRYRKEIIEKLCDKQTQLSILRKRIFRFDDINKKALREECKALEVEALSLVEKRIRKNEPLLCLLVKAIDDHSSSAQKCRSLLLSCLASATDDLYTLISVTHGDMCELVPSEDGDLNIYGYPFSSVVTRHSLLPTE